MKKADYASKFIDLHLHLDGAISVNIAKKLGKMQKIRLPAKNDAELEKMLTVPDDCTNLNDFLKCFALPQTLLQTEKGLSQAVYLVAEKIRKQGVIYAEIRFAPQLHCLNGLTQETAVIAALKGLKKSRLKANLILCCMRGNSLQEKNMETLRLAKKYLVSDGGVVALDLAGAEALFPTSDYKPLFEEAARLGVPFTIHAGEASGAESVRLAVEYGACRIGHGTRIFMDPAVENLIKEKGIFLEMCPTSNRQTCAVENMSDYPFMKYLDEGIKVTLNTDDPAIEGTTLAKEFRYMEKEFGLTAEKEKLLLANSIAAAFTTEKVKLQLKKILGL